MKATAQYFPVVVFNYYSVQAKMVLTWVFSEILKRQSDESYWAVLSSGIMLHIHVQGVVRTFESLIEIQKCGI